MPVYGLTELARVAHNGSGKLVLAGFQQRE